MSVLILILWFVFAIMVGAAANARGRSGFGWFLLASIVSPLIAIVFLIAFPMKLAGATKICQFCRTKVSREATVCPQCQRDIDNILAIDARAKQAASQR